MARGRRDEQRPARRAGPSVVTWLAVLAVLAAAILVVLAMGTDPGDAESRTRARDRAAASVAIAVVATWLAWRYARRPLRYGRGPYRCYGLAISPGVAGRPVYVGREFVVQHTSTTAGSGGGKSMKAAYEADQAIRSGAGIVVIDPDASLPDRILRHSAPLLARRGCVILWPGGDRPPDDPAALAAETDDDRRARELLGWTLPWNPLHRIGAEEPWEVASRFMGACKRIWGFTDQHVRIVNGLSVAARACSSAGFTPLEILPFLTDARFRAFVVDQCADVQQRAKLQAWADEMAALTPAAQDELVRSTRNRMERFEHNRNLRRLIGLGVTNAAYRQAYRATGTEARGRRTSAA